MNQVKGRSINLFEMAWRDGIQSEHHRIPSLAVKMAWAQKGLAAGLRRLEIGSIGIHYDRLPALRDTADFYRALQPAAEQAGARVSAIILNQRGLDDALAVGFRELAVVIGVDPVFEARNTRGKDRPGRTPDESKTIFAPIVAEATRAGCTVRGYVSTCYTTMAGDPIALPDVVRFASALQAMGCTEISLGDTFATATPQSVTTLLAALTSNGIPVEKIAAHFHVHPQRHDVVIPNLDAAFNAGVNTFDTTFAGIGGCPSAPEPLGNVATEVAVAWLQAKGLATEYNRPLIQETAGLVKHHFGI